MCYNYIYERINILQQKYNQLKPKKISDLINHHFGNKKITIVDCGCHKGQFLKKIGLKKLRRGILVDPIDFDVIKKNNLKNFKYFKFLVGKNNKLRSFKIYSDKYPEWSSVNKLGKSSIYKKNYSKYLNSKILEKKIKQITLDKLLSNNRERFDILKIDCQSTTFEILKGGEKSLKSKKFKLIIVAINLGEFYENTKDDFIKISMLLKKSGYNLLNIANAHTSVLGSFDYDFKDFKIWTFDAIFTL